MRDQSDLNFDPQVEDPQELAKLSRRIFLGLVGSAGAALSGCAPPQSSAVADEPNTAAPVASGAIDLESLPAAPAADDEKAWEAVAAGFLLRPGLIYMNTGTRGPSPRYVHESQAEALTGINSDYLGYSRNVYDAEFRKALRSKLADFVGANTSEVALMNNTTDGMIAGTWGLDFDRGDQVLYTNHDHSGGTHTVLHRAERDGLDVRVVDLSDKKFHPAQSPDDYVKAIEAEMTSKTKLLSFCHINYTDGAVLPVKEICEMARAKGVLTIVDGAQPPGMLKLNMHELGCDMYAGPFHKWMLSSMYTGFFYVRDDVRERVAPVLTSMPLRTRTMYGVKPTGTSWEEYGMSAAQYERRGSVNTPARMAMNAALDYHNHLTPQGVEARDRYLGAKLRSGLRAMDGVDVYVSDDERMSCALVSFTVRGVGTKDLNDMLWEQNNIYIRNVTHEEIDWDVNRASMHIMVTAAQVDTLLGAIGEIAGRATA